MDALGSGRRRGVGSSAAARLTSGIAPPDTALASPRARAVRGRRIPVRTRPSSRKAGLGPRCVDPHRPRSRDGGTSQPWTGATCCKTKPLESSLPPNAVGAQVYTSEQYQRLKEWVESDESGMAMTNTWDPAEGALLSRYVPVGSSEVTIWGKLVAPPRSSERSDVRVGKGCPRVVRATSCRARAVASPWARPQPFERGYPSPLRVGAEETSTVSFFDTMARVRG